MRCCELFRHLSHKLLFFLFLSLLAFGQSEITLKEKVQYKDHLFLKDIAKIYSQNSSLSHFLSKLPLKKEYLMDYMIDKDEIADLLKRNALDPSLVRIKGQRVKLFKRGTLTKEEVLKAIENFIQSHYRNIQVKSIRVSKVKPITGDYSIYLLPTSESFRYIYLKVFVESSTQREKMRATVMIDRFKDVAVASKEILKGSVIKPAMIMKKRVKILNSAQDFLLPSEVVGKVAKRDIKRGKIIKGYYIEPLYVVRKRTTVKVLYKKGDISIELRGYVLDNGKIGDIIRVKNISTNKVFRCKVLSNGLVRFLY